MAADGAQHMAVDGDVGCQYEYQWSLDEQSTIKRYEEWLREEWDRLKKFKDSPHDNIKWKKQPTHPKMLLAGEKKEE